MALQISIGLPFGYNNVIVIYERLKRDSVRPFIWLLLCTVWLVGADHSYDDGKKLYFAKGCNGCHGIDAKGLAQYPGLAYRPKAFLNYKLQRYRNKIADTQQSQLMIPFAKELTDAQIEKLITFFSQYHEEEIHQTTERRIKGDGGS
jgi:cytochrome c553